MAAASPPPLTPEGLRDRRTLARAITLVESTRDDHRAAAEALVDEVLPGSGSSVRIGVTGPPGAGKSTFIEAFGLHVAQQARRLAVLAVDPSSSVSGGSILGDKTRMGDLARHPDVFIRPSPGAGQLGGVARRTRESILLCEAAGYDVVLVETIGVGQSEVAVADMVDAFVLLTSPGAGDELQGIKRGIMEMVDVVVVNKADGEMAAAAKRAVGDYRSALALLAPRRRSWRPEVIACSALERTGIDEVWDAVVRFGEAMGSSGELAETRAEQAKAWMWSEVHDTLLERFTSDPEVAELVRVLEQTVAAGEVAPPAAARKLLELR